MMTDNLSPGGPSLIDPRAVSPRLGPEGQSPGNKPDEQSDDTIRERSAVKLWAQRIKKAKDKWAPDFKRMRENMEFVTGLQWDGQKRIDDEAGRYVANQTLQMVERKVATLYARNPTAEVKPRKRLYFALWDEDVTTLTEAHQRVQMSFQAGIVDTDAMAVMADFMHGRAQEAMVKKVCRTLELLHQYEIDASKPEFKEQMKQLVRRAVTCGVGYVRPNFVRDDTPGLSTIETRHTLVDRAKLAHVISQKYEEGKIEETDAQLETLRSLFLSMGVSQQTGDEYQLPERVEYDFPPATSIIPDPSCRSLKEFIAARWVAQEFILPLDEVNAFFGSDISAGGKLVEYGDDGQAKEGKPHDEQKDKLRTPLVCLWEVLDYTTKTHCFIVDGWKDYVLTPEPLSPCVSGFWPVFALSFNDVESEPGTKASIFPPSDVDLVKCAQKEWNRTRDALRDQRNANAPTYLARKGLLTDEDKKKIADREPNQLVELEGVPSGTNPAEVIAVLQVARIDPAVYDTDPLEQDMQNSAGFQQANLGPAQPDVTATVGTIAEQSRMTVSSSNVDDLDGLLSRVTRASCEMKLQGMSEDTVVRVCDAGYSWPSINRAEYLNMIEMTIVAGSSGRPNKAIETANFREIAPILLNAGANPFGVVQEGVRRMDDQLDVSKFLPIQLPLGQPQAAGPQQPGRGPQGPQQPQRPSMPAQGPPVAMAGAPEQ